MRFTKAFIGVKPGKHEKILKSVEKTLEDLGVKHTTQRDSHVNLIIIIGGDGTLLHHQNMYEVPIFGINGGESVGHYLTAGPDDYIEKLKKIIKGTEGKDYEVKILTRLTASVNDKPVGITAVNEVLISAIYTRNTLRAEMIANKKISLEMNTGIIVYTPQGSTAYASAVGAKLLSWESDEIGIGAIAPYKGTLVKGEILTKEPVTVIPISRKAELSLDGQAKQTYSLISGDIVNIRKADSHLRLVWID